MLEIKWKWVTHNAIHPAGLPHCITFSPEYLYMFSSNIITTRIFLSRVSWRYRPILFYLDIMSWWNFHYKQSFIYITLLLNIKYIPLFIQVKNIGYNIKFKPHIYQTFERPDLLCGVFMPIAVHHHPFSLSSNVFY